MKKLLIKIVELAQCIFIMGMITGIFPVLALGLVQKIINF